ncbi:MAG: hypothetical protein EBW91_03790, partial [Proteobacteria bacterium]|nr:hypothetical protein [Pseudomonadota bacterium]
MNDYQADIQNWILNFLSKPNDVFAKFPPCPFAKRAWLDDKVAVIFQYGGSQALINTMAHFNDEFDLII